MPTETFFRLPEEKRERIINAGWEEFCGVSYAQASINRIIRAAEIPRGSFYQYFADKDDLFLYLIEGARKFALEGYLGVLRACSGDMFRAALAAYDEVRRAWGTSELLPVRRCFDFARQNPGMDFQKYLSRPGDEALLDPVWEAIDTARLRRRDLPYVRVAFQLCILALGSVVMDFMARPEHGETNRSVLEEQIKIIEYGCKEDIT